MVGCTGNQVLGRSPIQLPFRSRRLNLKVLMEFKLRPLGMYCGALFDLFKLEVDKIT